MARIRTIKPEYWSDETVGSVSIPARLMFPATWNFADDEGLINWSPTYLKASIFPYDHDVSIEDVAGWMKELEDAGFVHVYSTSRAKHRVAFVITFREHQRIDKPQCARMPVPNWRDPGVVMVYARRDGFVCARCTEPVNEEFAADADGRRYDPICQRAKPVSERPGGPDDPSNVQVVHVMCARDFDPEAPLTPIRGSFREGSENSPGTIQERSSVPVSPVSPLPQALATPVTQSDEGPEETPGQSIPGTFQERSQEEGKGREGKRKGKENPTAPEALFGLPSTPPPDDAADKPQPKGSKRKTKADPSTPSSPSRGTRIPEDFAITDAMREWGRKRAPHVNGPAATEEFIDYWRGIPGARGVKLDWIATWRNRMRDLEDRATGAGAVIPIQRSRGQHQPYRNDPTKDISAGFPGAVSRHEGA